jgi:hypothetical protein
MLSGSRTAQAGFYLKIMKPIGAAPTKGADCRFYLLAGISLLLVLLIAADGVRKGVDAVIPTYYRHTASLAIAISEAAHGTSGMVGLAEVEKTLDKYGYGIDFNRPRMNYLNTHPQEADAALRAAADVTISDRSKTFGLMLNETGMIDYYYLAFKIFGYHVRSIYALYIGLLAVIALCFACAFRRRAIFIVPSILYLLLLLIFQDRFPAHEFGLGPLTNSRMLPYVSLYPVLFCLTLVGSGRGLRWVDAMATAIAGLIFAFVVDARTYAYWQVGPLVLILVLIGLARVVPWQLPLRKRVAHYCAYPVLVFACCAGILIENHHWRRDPAVYSTATFAGHEYWLNYIDGTLPVFKWRIPELEQQSGVHIDGNDSYGGALLRIKIKERGERLEDYQVGDWWNQAKRDELARQIAFDLWRDYPGLMIENYLWAFKPITGNFMKDVALSCLAFAVISIGPLRRLFWLLRAALVFAVGGIDGVVALAAAGLRYAMPAARRLSSLIIPISLPAICVVPTVIVMPFTHTRMVESASAFTDPRMADIDFVVWLCLLICCCGLRLRLPQFFSGVATGRRRCAGQQADEFAVGRKQDVAAAGR